MADKKFMSGGGGDFGGGGASGDFGPLAPTTSTGFGGFGTDFSVNPSKRSVTTSTGFGGIGIDPTVAHGNSFSHETNNIVPNSENINSQFVKFQPNILDNYDVNTYHFKLFIVDSTSSTSGKIFNTDNQIIIAESGVSDLTIDHVEIQSLATPSVESGTGTATTVKFEIVEPAGAGLIDKIYYQSLALENGNWSVMPFYLQLQFKGRTANTSEVDDGSPGTIGSLRWIWPLKLGEIKANVTTVGTRYEFSAIILDDLAQTNTYSVLQHALVLDNLSTFANAMQKLQDKLNEDQLYRLLGTVSIPDVYKIIIDPKISPYNITPVNQNANSQRNSSTTFFNGKNATFPYGTSIDKIVDSLLSQTEEYQKLIKNSDTPDGQGNPMNAEVNQMKKFWRITTEARPLQYDPQQNNYAREFTIFIIQYDIGVLDSTTAQDSVGSSTLEAERKRLMTYINKGILRKKYNYIFTGLNDQIMNFDIKINNAFTAVLNRMDGIYYNTAMSDMGVVAQNNAAVEASLSEKIQRVLSFQNSASPFSPAAFAQVFQDTSTAIEAANLSPVQKRNIITLLSQQKVNRLNNVTQSQLPNDNNVDITLNQTKIRSNRLATPRVDNFTQQNLSFISDINVSQQPYVDFANNIKGKLRPVARIDGMQQRQTGTGIESNSNSGIQNLSSMFSVALHSDMDVSFAKITLRIKGDPYWLVPQPVVDDPTDIYNSLKSPADAIDWLKNAHRKKDGSVNIYGTDNFIIVRFRTPRVFDIVENPDSTDPFSEVRTLSGVFKVTKITSKFESGVFSQELYCLIDHNIDISKFMDIIENNDEKPDIPTPPNELVNNSPIPSEFTKNPRIMATTSNTAEQIAIAQGSLSKGPALTTNVPTALANILPGLPNTFG